MLTAPGLNERMDYLPPTLSLCDFGIYLSVGAPAPRGAIERNGTRRPSPDGGNFFLGRPMALGAID
jgi:hypothetical protein